MRDPENETRTVGPRSRPKTLSATELSRLLRAFEAWRAEAPQDQVRLVGHTLGLLLCGGRTGRADCPASAATIRQQRRVAGLLARYDAERFGPAGGKP